MSAGATDSQRDTVRTFWHGALTDYERLSLVSFLAHGHRVEFYSYEERDVRELPKGVLLCDAEPVLPRDRFFVYGSGFGKGSPAGFANQFRYALLLQKGGIWADLDMLCLRSLAALPGVCAGYQDAGTINNALMRFPAGHPLLEELLERSARVGSRATWGEAGPRLLTALLAGKRHDVDLLPRSAFYPIPWPDAWKLISPAQADFCRVQVRESYCVHWWNEAQRRIGLAKDRLPPAGSWMGEQARGLLPSAPAGAYWQAGLVEQWIRNFRKTDIHQALSRFDSVSDGLADVLREFGRQRLAEGAYPRAIECLEAALRLRPKGQRIRLLLAEALIAGGQAARAEELLVPLRGGEHEPEIDRLLRTASREGDTGEPGIAGRR